MGPLKKIRADWKGEFLNVTPAAPKAGEDGPFDILSHASLPKKNRFAETARGGKEGDCCLISLNMGGIIPPICFYEKGFYLPDWRRAGEVKILLGAC